ncbi:ubiquinol-cytochrome C chaperone-domain-containing protein, partial [Terfezia claveryi]
IIEKLASKIREIAPEQTETYRAYSRGKELYQECAKQAAYMGPGQKMEMSDRAKFWYVDCQRPHSFNSWAQVTMLHMWALLVRFRAYPDKKKHDVWQQNFVDHFFYDAEEKMMKDYLIKSNPSRSKYLKDLFVVWRGLVAAYDEGLARHRHPLCADKISSGEAEGDAVLAAAIWRNVFDARPDTDLAMLTAVTAYTRRIVSGLDKLPDETIMEAGVVFGDPRREIE